MNKFLKMLVTILLFAVLGFGLTSIGYGIWLIPVDWIRFPLLGLYVLWMLVSFAQWVNEQKGDNK